MTGRSVTPADLLYYGICDEDVLFVERNLLVLRKDANISLDTMDDCLLLLFGLFVTFN